MSKVLLLNGGWYGSGLDKINYPVEVLADKIERAHSLVFVSGSELIRIGGKMSDKIDFEGFNPENSYCFFLGTEVEVLPDES